MGQSKNGSASASVDLHRKGKARRTIGARRNSCTCSIMSLRITGTVLAARIRVRGRRRGPSWRKRCKYEEDGEGGTNFPTSLDQALATAFAYNSANPNVVAPTASAQAQVLSLASDRTRRDSERQRELGGCNHVADETPSPSHAQVALNQKNDRTPESPRRKGNAAVFTHQRLSHAECDGALPMVAISQKNTRSKAILTTRLRSSLMCRGTHRNHTTSLAQCPYLRIHPCRRHCPTSTRSRGCPLRLDQRQPAGRSCWNNTW
ncbi:hypothetical protein V8E53_005779 [Lactarius tabidus]